MLKSFPKVRLFLISLLASLFGSGKSKWTIIEEDDEHQVLLDISSIKVVSQGLLYSVWVQYFNENGTTHYVKFLINKKSETIALSEEFVWNKADKKKLSSKEHNPLNWMQIVRKSSSLHYKVMELTLAVAKNAE